MSLLVSIFETYQGLINGLATNDKSLHVEGIPGFEWARLGVKQDAVLLLLPPEINSPGPDHDLEHIRISPNEEFNIRESQGLRVETVAVIATKSRDGWLVETFLELVAMLFDSGVSCFSLISQQMLNWLCPPGTPPQMIDTISPQVMKE